MLIKRIKVWSITLLAIAVVYGIGNFVLVEIQEYFKKDDKAQLEQYKKELKQEKKEIKNQEEWFDLSDKEMEEVDKKKQDMIKNITEMEDYMNANNIKPADLEPKYKEPYDWYVSQRNLFNKLTSDRERNYKETYDKYLENIEAYNEKVKSANNLAEKIGSTWIVVPIPGKGH
ncbi:hypothetical protein QNH39_13190 [Neobacillus novalis]|uniref:Uncharacterized protein n=1 Tax=Neobacillus novalis TaxID=220687 RepID=A0AA95MRN6_9BACI|nr:hypothetical protein [Neobacillus novalis]WHY88726.1 hypothetical protein QNH39_13190 [Neobacillus novalis]